jgi:hypothetical protein
MKQNIYTVFDSASGVFDRPFCAISDQAAVRAFGDICGNSEHPVGMHPDDYSLYRVGVFDNNLAEITPESKQCLITGPEVLSAARNANGLASAEEQAAEVSPGGTA